MKVTGLSYEVLDDSSFASLPTTNGSGFVDDADFPCKTRRFVSVPFLQFYRLFSSLSGGSTYFFLQRTRKKDSAPLRCMCHWTYVAIGLDFSILASFSLGTKALYCNFTLLYSHAWVEP